MYKLSSHVAARWNEYETTASASEGLLCIRDTFITCNVRSVIMVQQDHLMSRR